MTFEFVFFSSNPLLNHINRKMSPTIRHKYKYFYSAVQRANYRRQKFHFCRLPFDVRPRNVKLNLSNISSIPRIVNLGRLRFVLNNPHESRIVFQKRSSCIVPIVSFSMQESSVAKCLWKVQMGLP